MAAEHTLGHRRRRLAWRKAGRSTVLHLIVILSAVLIGFPFFYMISSSFKTFAEVYRVPMTWLPASPQWQNFVEVWKRIPVGRFAINSTIFTVGSTLGGVAVGLLAGFAFGRLRFPGKNLLFLVLLLAYMIPGQITLVPRFMLLSDLKWINTYQGLIVPQLGGAFVAFLLRQHFMSLPDELFDAAEIDGAGYLRQLLQIALPISRPIVVTLVLLQTVSHWNQYLWPLIVTNTASMRTLTIGIQTLKTQDTLPQWHLINAAATLVVLPLLLLFLFMQKQFVEGAIQGALKG